MTDETFDTGDSGIDYSRTSTVDQYLDTSSPAGPETSSVLTDPQVGWGPDQTTTVFDPDSTDVDQTPEPDPATDPDQTTEPDQTTDQVGEDPPSTDTSSVWAELSPEVRAQYEGQFWQQQTENGFCAPTSVAIVVSEIVGERLDAGQFVDRAQELGLLGGSPGAWTGLTIAETETLFESFGVPSTVVQPDNATDAWDQLTTYAQDGNHGVVAYIDSSEVWEGTDDDGSGLALDHAVVVSHVDDDFVYLEDPGSPDGQELKVSRDVFMDAWDDSSHGMVVTDQPIGVATTETTDVPVDVDPTLTTDQPVDSDPTQTSTSPTEVSDPAPGNPVQVGTAGWPSTGLGDLQTTTGGLLTPTSVIGDVPGMLNRALVGRSLVMLPVVLSAGAVLVAAKRARA